MNKEIEKFAVEQGYKSAIFLCKWREYDCYEPIVNDEDVAFVGLPLLILVDGQGRIRMSTPEEAMQQMDEMS